MRIVISIITLALVVLNSMTIEAQTNNSRLALALSIETEIETYITDNLSSFNLSKKDKESIKNSIKIGELSKENVSTYIETIKRHRLRFKYLKHNPEKNIFESNNTYRQLDCANEGFENQDITDDYNFFNQVNWNHNGVASVNLGANPVNSGFIGMVFPSGVPPIDDDTINVSIVNTLTEPILQQFNVVNNGTRAIKLNPTNGNQENATILSTNFVVNDDILSLNFAVLFDNPDHGGDGPGTDSAFNPFILIEVYDNVLNTTVATRGINSANSDGVLISDQDSSWRYAPWSCLNLDVSQSLNHDVTLRIIVSDCSLSQHDAIAYIDDICNNGNVCTTSLFGSMFLDPVNLNCPDGPFQVCGTFNPPAPAVGNPQISLDILDLGGNVINTITNVTINNFNNTFCFNVNPSDFGVNPNGSFNFSATATFTTNTNQQIIITDDDANIGADISFLNCPIDPCGQVTGAFLSGTYLCWTDVTTEDYKIEFITQENCPNGASSNPTPVFVSYTQNSNCIDLLTVQSALGGKCFRWRIQTDCGPWSDWCLIATGTETMTPVFVTFDDCTPTSPCENFEETITINTNVLSGEIMNYLTYEKIIADNTIEANAVSIYQASNSIRLIPGFHAQEDSNFTARIIPCEPAISPSQTRLTPNIKLARLKVFPNPASNHLTVSIEDKKLQSLELITIYGNSIQIYNKLNSSKYTINVENLSRGYYILKITLDDGNIEYKTFILK